MSELFSDTQIAELTEQINAQLREIEQGGMNTFSKGGADKKKSLAKQRKAIKEAAGEDPDRFIRRFARNAKKDLCEPGGLLHKQWKEMKDLSSKKMIKTFGSVLAGMGVAALPMQTLVVALGVYVLHIGIETICEETK
ncbi:MAG: hypothetical protein GY862_35085 [Gammaproteobacteria bacterium]|nr:hypothetical protein [Gammaproteobacteria bacterium]